MSTYVMSDIHGCFDELQAILAKTGFSESDELILAGDLIERGPKNYEMLRWLEEKKLYEIARLLSYKFTDDEKYIEHEIQTSGPGTLMFALVPEHMTGKIVNES